MKVLAIESFGAFLGRKGDRIVIKKKKEKLAEIPAGNIDLIKLSVRGVSASMDAIYLALKYNIPIVLTNKNGKPLGVVLPFTYRGLVNVRKRQFEAQDSPIGVKIAKALVYAKIANQAQLIYVLARTWKKLSSDSKAALMGARNSMLDYLKKLDKIRGESCEEVREQLMSIEARAAQHYWHAFSRLTPKELEFHERVKKGACDVVNVMLNYGYAILATDVWLSILKAGLDPWAGFLHANSQRRPGMVYDLMEPFRAPIVDKTILHLVSLKKGNLQSYLQDCRLTPEGRSLVAEAVIERLRNQIRNGGRRLTFSDIILLHARRIALRLANKRPYYKPFLWKG